MNEELLTMLALALRPLPARIGVEHLTKVLGFTDDDITILMADPKLDLKPLGNPAPNAPKYFAAAHILKLANNPEWLDKASNAIRRHHLQKRKRIGAGQQQNHLQRNLQRNLQQPTVDGQ
jgi:hypothetical protein